MRFRNTRIEGRTALYAKTYWRGPTTGAFCETCELIANPGVGLNLPGGDALMEFRDTVVPNGKFALPHHGYVNGGLLASQYVFSGDTSGVDIKAFDTEGENTLAIVVTVGDTNHILRQDYFAVEDNDYAGLGCTNDFQDGEVLTCGAAAGKLRPLKLYGSGPNPITVNVQNPDNTQYSNTFNFYDKVNLNNATLKPQTSKLILIHARFARYPRGNPNRFPRTCCCSRRRPTSLYTAASRSSFAQAQ